MSADSRNEQALLLFEDFRAALAAETLAREAVRARPGDGELVRELLRAMARTNEVSKRLRQAARL